MEKAYLVLQNGKVYEGTRFGAQGDVTGEAVFTTGMVGYLETISDPGYFGQIVVQTFPLIGNYGVIGEDFSSEKPWLTAYVARSICDAPSNFRCEGKLNDYLAAQGVVGLMGVDTRAITRQIRRHGKLNAAIVSQLPSDLSPLLAQLSAFEAPEPVRAGSGAVPQPCQDGSPLVLWDLGHAKPSLQALQAKRANVCVVPAGYSAQQILDLKPSGVLLSNGPGDPAKSAALIQTTNELLGAGLPMLGIGLGHQLMALAAGANIQRLPFGHRGANQPVVNTKTRQMYTTNQNHGHSVSAEGLPDGVSPSYLNANDQSIEGLEYPCAAQFSVQFQPDEKDALGLINRFILSTKEGK